ncbi:MAG: hypothetical protein IKA43_03545 [Clostridia bacterium]|nr:hypothetical protein [Clostridia bacterium]MBR2296463.1 hypothetical protein [Clostridia bacterium]
MKTAEERQMEKELKIKEKIANAIVEIDEAVNTFESFARSLDNEIDEAALNGDDELSNELLQVQADMEDMAREFKYIRTSIRSMANITLAFNSVSKLPAYIKGCNKVISGIPSLTGISKGFNALRRKLGRFRQQIRGMRDDMRTGKGKRFTDIYTGSRQSDADTLKRCQERREARIAARLGGVATTPVTAEATTPATNPATNMAGATVGGGAGAGATPSPSAPAGDSGASAGGAGINDLLGMMDDVNGGGNGTI